MDLQFDQIYNIALFAVLFAMACGLIQIFLSMLGRRWAVRMSLILLFAICAAALVSLLAADVFDGTLLENAKVENLITLDRGAEFLLYARIYMRHKTAENLAMQSPHLMAALVRWAGCVTGLDWINWKAKKPHEMLRITKPEYKQLCELQGEDVKKAVRWLYAVAACAE